MATDFLVKQGRVMGGVRLVTDADVAHQTDLTNIRETGTTSSQAISAGTYFYLNNVLVRAKVAIASGATFTLNTNYEVVTAGALNEINNKFNYSTTEHVVGKWIDGSTLYEKTISCGALPNTSSKNVSYGVTGSIMVLSFEGITMKNQASKPIPYIWNSTNQFIAIEFGNTYMVLNTTADYSSYLETYVTIRYTKTS